MMRGILFLCMALAPLICFADAAPLEAYRDAIVLAASGRDAKAVEGLQAAQAMLPKEDDFWRPRMLAAAALLEMRSRQADPPVLAGAPMQQALLASHLASHPRPRASATWPVGLAATVIPGAGHAWLGRWRDAGVTAFLVWPMLLLTFWAAKRRMGPVTVFFAAITIWLWSGTIFSAISLAERANAEVYLTWWQGLWQASGLPGRPW